LAKLDEGKVPIHQSWSELYVGIKCELVSGTQFSRRIWRALGLGNPDEDSHADVARHLKERGWLWITEPAAANLLGGKVGGAGLAILLNVMKKSSVTLNTVRTVQKFP